MNVILGAIAWVVIVLVPLDPNRGIGTIEKLLLLGPLVVVPLGWQLAGVRLSWIHPATAFAVVCSFLMPVGWPAGMMTAPWLIVCGATAIIFLKRIGKKLVLPDGLCRGAALAGLVMGAVGLLQSRWGMEPLGFYEPWVLLVAVHFHFAAFVTPLITGEVVARLTRGKWPLTIGACLGSPVLAGGYVLHVPALRLVGATLLAITLVVVAGWTLWNLKEIRPRAAQLLLGVSSLSVVAAMGYATVYAVGDFFGEVWVAIPQMARTHGVLQAVGFGVCGLWGWLLVERSGRAGLHSLTRRWQ